MHKSTRQAQFPANSSNNSHSYQNRSRPQSRKEQTLNELPLWAAGRGRNPDPQPKVHTDIIAPNMWRAWIRTGTEELWMWQTTTDSWTCWHPQCSDPHGHGTLVHQCAVRCKSPNDNTNDSHENDDEDDDDKYQDLEIAVSRMWKSENKTYASLNWSIRNN